MKHGCMIQMTKKREHISLKDLARAPKGKRPKKEGKRRSPKRDRKSLKIPTIQQELYKDIKKYIQVSPKRVVLTSLVQWLHNNPKTPNNAPKYPRHTQNSVSRTTTEASRNLRNRCRTQLDRMIEEGDIARAEEPVYDQTSGAIRQGQKRYIWYVRGTTPELSKIYTYDHYIGLIRELVHPIDGLEIRVVETIMKIKIGAKTLRDWSNFLITFCQSQFSHPKTLETLFPDLSEDRRKVSMKVHVDRFVSEIHGIINDFENR